MKKEIVIITLAACFLLVTKVYSPVAANLPAGRQGCA